MTTRYALTQWWHARQQRRERRKLLAGRDPEPLLAASPYKIGWWQGEDGYRVYDSRQPDTVVASGVSREEGELLCLRLYLQEQAARTPD